jgi:hypothetical protein
MVTGMSLNREPAITESRCIEFIFAPAIRLCPLFDSWLGLLDVA